MEYITHGAAGLETMRRVFGCEAGDLVYSNGQGWAVENLTASSHCGTHVDAPYHYGASSGGKPARRIDEVPLQWRFAPGVVIDIRQKNGHARWSTMDYEESVGARWGRQSCRRARFRTGLSAREDKPVRRQVVVIAGRKSSGYSGRPLLASACIIGRYPLGVKNKPSGVQLNPRWS